MARGDLPALEGEGTFEGEFAVDRILARRDEWSLALVRTTGEDPRGARLAGQLSGAEAGDRIAVRAAWSRHPKYGPTLQAQQVDRLGIDERGALVDVLRAIRHIGPRYAESLVERFGESTIAKIDDDPEAAFKKVPGLGAVRAKESARAWRKDEPKRPLRLLLARHRVGWLTDRLFKALGPQAVDRITADPYALTSVHGVGIRTADAIARAVGVEPGGDSRARAVLVEVLREAAMRQGHVALPVEEAVRRADALGLDPPVALPEDLSTLADGKVLILREGLLADAVLWKREEAVAKGLRRIADADPHPDLAAIKVPDPLEIDGKVLDDEQRAAVVAALQHPLSVATGLPGTGKTVLIEALAGLGSKALSEDLVALAAPTGRAARRIEEATGHDARTIHRMLGWVPGQRAERDADDPVEANLIVVDEASMLSLDVLEVLLNAIATGTQLVFVGDVDQLEPVGAGKPLDDLIESGACPVARLRTIKRQSQRSMIVHAAHAINRGERPEFNLDALREQLAAAAGVPVDEAPELDRDVFWIERHGPEAIADEIVELVTERLPKYAKVDPVGGQQVLAPVYRGPCGVTELGRRIREGLLGDAEPLGKTGFVAGEKLIATANDYEAGLVNGQVLRAIRMLGKGTLLVEQEDGGELEVPRASLPTLESAFAMTVHKAQGTEVPVLVMPVASAHRFLLDRKLLYTGVTRARQLCVLVGESPALEAAAAGQHREARITRLRELLAV
ncbi:MAG: AAA family ATPase [Solirubrobacteraceae bacterium]|nr:AAA family ATPase [Solirubrobacteraceae bacterium]